MAAGGLRQIGGRRAITARKLSSGRAIVVCKRAKMVKPRCRSHAIRRKGPASSPYADRPPDDLPDHAPGWWKGKMAGRGGAQKAVAVGGKNGKRRGGDYRPR